MGGIISPNIQHIYWVMLSTVVHVLRDIIVMNYWYWKGNVHVDDFEHQYTGIQISLILACFVQNLICLVNAAFSTVNRSELLLTKQIGSLWSCSSPQWNLMPMLHQHQLYIYIYPLFGDHSMSLWSQVQYSKPNSFKQYLHACSLVKYSLMVRASRSLKGYYQAADFKEHCVINK